LIDNLLSTKDPAKTRSFFRPIIDNINQLQVQGLSIKDRHLKFSFSTMVADNLASHFIGGFQMSFNNRYFCRRCYITQAEKSLPINSIKLRPRTIIHHDSLLQRINANPLESPLMGIVGLSPVVDLIGFHPITSLPADIMHDYFEGVTSLVIMKLLKQASTMRIMTYGKKILSISTDRTIQSP